MLYNHPLLLRHPQQPLKNAPLSIFLFFIPSARFLESHHVAPGSFASLLLVWEFSLPMIALSVFPSPRLLKKCLQVEVAPGSSSDPQGTFPHSVLESTRYVFFERDSCHPRRSTIPPPRTNFCVSFLRGPVLSRHLKLSHGRE